MLSAQKGLRQLFKTLPAATLLFGLAAAQEASGNVSEWTGTITMYAQSYTPNLPDAEVPLTALQEAADEYQAAHPGITIEFVTEEIPDVRNTIRVEAAAGDLFDVFWAQWGDLNSTLPQGVAVDLTPYFAEPNPYAPEFATWAEAMNPTIVAETAAPGGASYNINGDFVATGFFYNKTLFEQAGITKEPTTWPELLELANTLSEAGVAAEVGVPLYSWWQRHFLSDFYAEEYEQMAAYDDVSGLSALDQACATHNGLLSTEDPRFMAWWPIFKEFTDTWVPDYLALSPEQNTQAQQDFIGSQAAMIYEGSWMPNTIRAAGATFEFDSFNFPVLSQDVSEYSTGTATANAVGGPNAGYQFAVATPRANETMEEPGKFEAVLDWLQYLGTAQVSEKIINENGSYVPIFNGAEAGEGSESLATQADLELRAVQVGGTTATVGEEIQRTFGLYLSGNLDIEGAASQMQIALDRSVDEYARTNEVDLATQCQ